MFFGGGGLWGLVGFACWCVGGSTDWGITTGGDDGPTGSGRLKWEVTTGSFSLPQDDVDQSADEGQRESHPGQDVGVAEGGLVGEPLRTHHRVDDGTAHHKQTCREEEEEEKKQQEEEQEEEKEGMEEEVV